MLHTAWLPLGVFSTQGRAGEEEREDGVKHSLRLGAPLATFGSTTMPIFVNPFPGPHITGLTDKSRTGAMRLDYSTDQTRTASTCQ